MQMGYFRRWITEEVVANDPIRV